MLEQFKSQPIARAPHFTVHRQGEDRQLLLSEDGSFRLRGRIHAVPVDAPGDGVRLVVSAIGLGVHREVFPWHLDTKKGRAGRFLHQPARPNMICLRD